MMGEEKFTLSNTTTLTEAYSTTLMPTTMAIEGLMDRPIATKLLILNAIIQGSSHPAPLVLHWTKFSRLPFLDPLVIDKLIIMLGRSYRDEKYLV